MFGGEVERRFVVHHEGLIGRLDEYVLEERISTKGERLVDRLCEEGGRGVGGLGGGDWDVCPWRELWRWLVEDGVVRLARDTARGLDDCFND